MSGIDSYHSQGIHFKNYHERQHPQALGGEVLLPPSSKRLMERWE